MKSSWLRELQIEPDVLVELCNSSTSEAFCKDQDFWYEYYYQWVLGEPAPLTLREEDQDWKQAFYRDYRETIFGTNPNLIWVGEEQTEVPMPEYGVSESLPVSHVFYNISPDDHGVILVPLERDEKRQYYIHPYFYQLRFVYPGSKRGRAEIHYTDEDEEMQVNLHNQYRLGSSYEIFALPTAKFFDTIPDIDFIQFN